MQRTKYINTYFRIDCGYPWGSGIDANKYDFLKSEIQNIFLPLGFEIKKNHIAGASDTAYRNKESLYLHPSSFSGYVLEASISEIKEALVASELKLVSIDTYEILYDECASFLLESLQDAKKSIREEIFEKYKTTRKTTFIKKSYTIDSCKIKLLDKELNNKIYREFVSSVINEMVAQKLLIKTHEHPGYYRSLNKTELKSWEKVNGPAFTEAKFPIINDDEENLFTLFDLNI